jgi:hypothetical protein
MVEKTNGVGNFPVRDCRDFIMGAGLVPSDKYKELKEFSDKINTDDAQPTLLKLPVKGAVSN